MNCLKYKTYRVFIKYCVFSLKCCDFSELCQFCCSAGFLPAWFVYTHWHRGKTESGIFQRIRKKTQYLMNNLYLIYVLLSSWLSHYDFRRKANYNRWLWFTSLFLDKLCDTITAYSVTCMCKVPKESFPNQILNLPVFIGVVERYKLPRASLGVQSWKHNNPWSKVQVSKFVA